MIFQNKQNTYHYDLRHKARIGPALVAVMYKGDGCSCGQPLCLFECEVKTVLSFLYRPCVPCSNQCLSEAHALKAGSISQ